jgi:hypothetical protein
MFSKKMLMLFIILLTIFLSILITTGAMASVDMDTEDPPKPAIPDLGIIEEVSIILDIPVHKLQVMLVGDIEDDMKPAIEIERNIPTR